MKLETLPQRPSIPESAHELSLYDLEQMSADDTRLQELYNEIKIGVDNYIEALRQHTAWSDRITLQLHHNDKKYAQHGERTELDRHTTHQHLIIALQSFAARCRQKKIPTPWWNGPDGLFVGNNTDATRKRVFDWAAEVFLDNED